MNHISFCSNFGNMSSVDWCSLPPELLEAVAKNLTIHAHYIRFRAVCRAWRSSSSRTHKHLPCQLPWLLLPQNGSFSHRRAFYDLANNRIHALHLPEASRQHRRRLCGSSHGWLTVMEESPCIFLLNPLTRERINLPPLSLFPNVASFDFANIGREYVLRFPESAGCSYYSLCDMRDSFIKKMVLSNSPSSGSPFVALAIINPGDVLAFCKSGLNSWKYIEEARSFTEDVTYMNGLFYAVDKNGNIAVCDVRGDSPNVQFIYIPQLILRGDMRYLVVSMGKLLLVTRFLELSMDSVSVLGNVLYRTGHFHVFKLDSAQLKWEEMMSLDNMLLFLGNNSSLALMASDFPGCKGNKIYFSDDHSEAQYYDSINEDVGVYNLEDGSVHTLPCCPSNSDPQLLWSPPIWITPNPC